MYKLLDTINSPEDLRKLSKKKLRGLSGEIRKYMVECCAVNPGHLGSSLGAVEIVVALHYVYNTPQDKIVFDVGHQAYAHKIITGRKEAFRKQRTGGGISGFPKMSESPYDAFGAGHSSISISAALGYAEAARIKGESCHSVAVIGDGALTGGLAWEGLNNAGISKADILVVLNDNNMSIDEPGGGLHNYLLKITTSRTYNRLKSKVWNVLGEGKVRSWLQKQVLNAKSGLVRRSGGDLFESMGLRYFGPVDGNDVDVLVKTLSKVKDLRGPRILHVLTKKGRGYAPAEADPTVWHAPGRFNPENGERIKTSAPAAKYQDVFGEVLCTLGKKDSRVVGITPAMASGCGMTAFRDAFPERFFDVGIEEEHAVTFSAGLAAGGLRPFCNIYSAFSQRAYDQIIHDVALQGLPVTLCFDRAGLVGEDGATHNGSFDLAAYRSIPGTVIAVPRNELLLKHMMYTALHQQSGPFIIRYPRGYGEGVSWKDEEFTELTPGRGQCLREGTDAAVLAIGPCVNRACEAAERLSRETGASVAVYDMRFLKPIDADILKKVESMGAVLTVEEGSLKGGLYGEVSEYFAPMASRPVIKGLGIPDRFIAHATREEQLAQCGLDADSIYAALRELLKK